HRRRPRLEIRRRRARLPPEIRLRPHRLDRGQQAHDRLREGGPEEGAGQLRAEEPVGREMMVLRYAFALLALVAFSAPASAEQARKIDIVGKHSATEVKTICSTISGASFNAAPRGKYRCVIGTAEVVCSSGTNRCVGHCVKCDTVPRSTTLRKF